MKLTLKEAIEIAQKMINAELMTGGYLKAIQTLIDHAKKSMEPLEGEALIGRKVRIVANFTDHDFQIGDDVELSRFDQYDNELSYKVKDACWINRSEFEVID